MHAMPEGYPELLRPSPAALTTTIALPGFSPTVVPQQRATMPLVVLRGATKDAERVSKVRSKHSTEGLPALASTQHIVGTQ